MTRALTLDILLRALTLTACDRRPSPNPLTPQTSKAEEATVALTRATAEFECPAPSGRFMIDDGTNRGPRQPVHTNCTITYTTCDAQSHAVFDYCPSGQVFDQRFSTCVVKDACDEIRS